MYKKQLTVQKILCLAALIMSALVFLYSLGIMTDLFDSLYQTIHNPNDPSSTEVPGSYIYYNMQGFNRMFLIFSIGLMAPPPPRKGPGKRRRDPPPARWRPAPLRHHGRKGRCIRRALPLRRHSCCC